MQEQQRLMVDFKHFANVSVAMRWQVP
jgi:hypothetical protein